MDKYDSIDNNPLSSMESKQDPFGTHKRTNEASGRYEIRRHAAGNSNGKPKKVVESAVLYAQAFDSKKLEENFRK